MTDADGCLRSSGGFLKLCKGRLQYAFQAVEHLKKQGRQIHSDILSHLLQECLRQKDLAVGRQVYSMIKDSNFESNFKLVCQLIHMFAWCGSMLEAHQVFSNIHKQNIFTWTAIILAHAQHGKGEQAMKLYHEMQTSGVKPSSYIFVAVLKLCSSLSALDEGKLIHANIIKHRLESDVFVGSALVDMYVKSSSLENARVVFDSLPKWDEVCWSAMIAGYAKHGHAQEALQLFKEMQVEGIEPTNITFVCVLKACASIAALDQGKLIHAEIINRLIESDLFVGSTLVDMYCKCGNLKDAFKVFEKLSAPNVVSWSAMISGYTEHGDYEKALQLFEEMQEKGTKPDIVTFICILKACAGLAALWKGIWIHTDIVNHGLELDVFIGNTLVGMYAKCGSLDESCKVFHKLREQNVVSWNAIIAGYAEHGYSQEVLRVFWKMQREGIAPNNVTYVYILKACAGIGDLDQGKQIHAKIQNGRFESDPFVGSTLVDMYAKCGGLEDACRVFEKLPARDVVSWSTMIAVSVEHGHCREALQTYKKMQHEGMKPDRVTFLWVLKACACIADLDKGKMIHSNIIKYGISLDLNVGNTLVDMYAKCGCLKDACKVFNLLQERDTVSWNAMIAGNVEHGQSKMALQLFERMQHEGIKPDTVTYMCSLKACASLTALDQGKLIHADTRECGLDLTRLIGSSLVDMYAKCGSLEDARAIFNMLPEHDLVSWSAMIAGCAQHGHSNLSVHHFESMLQQGIKPDGVTFVSLLSACNHAGLVKEGCRYFKSMRKDHGLQPTLEHYVSMVDLLGRAGCLYEAEDLIFKMPFQSNSFVWMALLASCAKFGNLELGQRAFNFLVKTDPQGAAGYKLMSKIYAANNMGAEVQKIQVTIH